MTALERLMMDAPSSFAQGQLEVQRARQGKVRKHALALYRFDDFFVLCGETFAA